MLGNHAFPMIQSPTKAHVQVNQLPSHCNVLSLSCPPQPLGQYILDKLLVTIKANNVQALGLVLPSLPLAHYAQPVHSTLSAYTTRD